jgi:hypothetical protein
MPNFLPSVAADEVRRRRRLRHIRLPSDTSLGHHRLTLTCPANHACPRTAPQGKNI